MRKSNSLLDSIPEVLGWYAGLGVSCGSALGLIEGWPVADCVWFVVVTISTTGFGDLYPHSVAGKGIAAILIVGAWLFNLLLGAQLAAKLIVNSDAWTHGEQEQVKRDLVSIKQKLGISDDG